MQSIIPFWAIQNIRIESLRPSNNPSLEQARQRLFRYRNFYIFHRRHGGISNKQQETSRAVQPVPPPLQKIIPP
ncbi:MAG: hypothetical protein ACFFD4_35045 [Candidatus Odinarchaeota archaeon]